MLINMKELLYVAKENKFAVPAFNIGSLEILKSVIEVAEESSSPVILEIHPVELNYLKKSFVEMVKNIAYEAKVPVVIHLDHGGSIEDVVKAVNCGFTSVMIDGSSLPYEENISLTQEVIKIVRPLNISVEAELGNIGATGTSFEGGTSGVVYTDPEQAKEFVKLTKIDTLAIAIGTAHGLYPKNFIPKLNLELLGELKNKVDIPFVLHGGSGNPDEEVSESVKLGVCKVNISSDVKSVFFKELKNYLNENEREYEPHVVLESSINEAKKVIKHKLILLNTINKAGLYR